MHNRGLVASKMGNGEKKLGAAGLESQYVRKLAHITEQFFLVLEIAHSYLSGGQI